jgi:hypothetical protein
VTRPETGSRAVRWLAWLRPLADAIMPVTMLRGRSRGTGEPATMLAAGSLARVQWLVDRFFAEPPARESLGHVPAWRLARTLRRHGASADLVIARVARVSTGALGFDNDWLPVPDWVGMRFVAPFDVAAIAKHSHSVADDLRRARRARFSAEISQHAPDLAVFHRDYYLPFVRNRHREEAFVRSQRFMRRRFRRGGILWIVRDGDRVAGVLFERRHEVLDAVALGTMRGDLAVVREGVVAAVYLQLIELARRWGCAAVDLRGSRPSPLDGLTRYKRKWGARVYDRADVVSTTLVRWPRLTPAVATLLAHLPLIFRDEGGLSVIGVADEADPAASRQALRMPELRRRILATRDAPSAVGARDDGVAIAPLDADASPRALLAAARPGIV